MFSHMREYVTEVAILCHTGQKVDDISSSSSHHVAQFDYCPHLHSTSFYERMV
jgi:hypothetical protein